MERSGGGEGRLYIRRDRIATASCLAPHRVETRSALVDLARNDEMRTRCASLDSTLMPSGILIPSSRD